MINYVMQYSSLGVDGLLLLVVPDKTREMFTGIASKILIIFRLAAIDICVFEGL